MKERQGDGTYEKRGDNAGRKHAARKTKVYEQKNKIMKG